MIGVNMKTKITIKQLIFEQSYGIMGDKILGGA